MLCCSRAISRSMKATTKRRLSAGMGIVLFSGRIIIVPGKRQTHSRG
jgi:hypothetical protein